MSRSSSKGGRRGERARNGTEMVPLNQQLESVYKPQFDQHGGSIPLSKLNEMMSDDPHFLQLLRQADNNQDGFLSYPEFVRIMQQKAVKQEHQPTLTRFQKVLKTAVGVVVPEHMMQKDVLDHYTCYPPPLFMISISVIELIIFVVYAFISKEKGLETSWRSGAPLYSPLTYSPYRRYEVWRFLTYMFIHDGISHLISNLIFQLVIGLPLELFHRFWRVGIVYSFGVIAGSLATSVLDNSTYLVGASGGCYALIGAHFATIIMNWKNMTHDWLSGPIKFILSAPVQLAFWSLYAGLDIGVAIYSRYHEGNKISYTAHFAGLLAGILLGIAVLRNIEVLLWENIVWWVSLSAYLLLLLFALLWNAFYPNYPSTDWKPCCPDVN